MKDERYKQIMNDFGMPNSQSLLSVLQQVANESGQECASEERENCALLCDKYASSYRAMKNNEEDITVLKECEELAYCCELNARFIRERHS